MGVVIYNCPNCGAPLKFENGQKMATCEHCGSQGTIEDAKAKMKYDYKIRKMEIKNNYKEMCFKYGFPALVILVILEIIFLH